MENISVLAIDIAKNNFELHGVNQTGRAVLKKSVKREKLVDFIVNLSGQLTIAMEACGGANHWGRTFQELGFSVKVISPQYVKGFLQGNKNDANDAQAIAMAAQHEGIPTVAIKNKEQQDLQTLHRIRESVVQQRTATGNMIRGFLQEYGTVLPKGLSVLRKQIPELLEDADNQLTHEVRRVIFDLYEQLLALDKRIEDYNKKFKRLAKEHPVCSEIMRLRGVGPIIAVLSYATMGDAAHFQNGRHYAAYLGLVPKEYSTGGKHKLMGISKRGNAALRGLMIHGARSVLKAAQHKNDPLSCWLKKLEENRGYNKCCVALANKLARHIWAIMKLRENYEAASFMLKPASGKDAD